MILQRSCWIAATALLILVCSSEPRFAEGYKNYTVGDSQGWYDELMKPGVDYQKWADAYTFSLGDFLIFNTDNNHSVVRTYNLTSYSSCDYTGEDSTEFANSDPSSTAVYPITVAVALVKEGATYFFSGDYDGWQCQHGAAFEIKVSHGQGLPPTDTGSSAMAPSPSADSGGDDSVPDTVIPGANFNHPRNVSGDSGDGGSGNEAENANASGSGSGSGPVLAGRSVLLMSVVGIVAASCFF